jgi:hypothetical protein
MTERPGREHGRDSVVRLKQNARAHAPAIVQTPLSVCLGLKKTGGNASGLRAGENLVGGLTEVLLALEGAAIEQKLTETRIVKRRGVNSKSDVRISKNDLEKGRRTAEGKIRVGLALRSRPARWTMGIRDG